jgi:hypothetical protein
MGEIYNAANQKVATIGDDGKVRSITGNLLGEVIQNGDVYNNTSSHIGSIESNGYVYQGATHIGTVHPDGRVFDAENHYAGKVVGAHMESGGAALLLLVR